LALFYLQNLMQQPTDWT